VRARTEESKIEQDEPDQVGAGAAAPGGHRLAVAAAGPGTPEDVRRGLDPRTEFHMCQGFSQQGQAEQ